MKETSFKNKIVEIERSILSNKNINIFDIFAAFYLYAVHKTNTINKKLSVSANNSSIHSRISELTKYLQLHNAIPEDIMAPLDDLTRKILFQEINRDSEEDSIIGCFTILQVVDKIFDKIKVRAISNVASRDSLSQQLNLDNNLGVVYPKSKSVIHNFIEKKVKICRNSGMSPDKVNVSRGPGDSGEFLRDKFSNLTCVQVPYGYNIDLQYADFTIRDQFPYEFDKCKIGLVPLVHDTSQFERRFFDLNAEKQIPFVFVGYNNIEFLKSKVISYLNKFNSEKSTIVCFPELCVPFEVRDTIRTSLKKGMFPNIKLIVAGSFHEKTDSGWTNTSYVIGPSGQDLWKQNKLHPFVLKDYQSKKLRKEATKENDDKSDFDLCENIVTDPKEITVYDSPLGRAVVLICSDFILEGDVFLKMLYDVGVNIIFVPAFTGMLEGQFTRKAESFSHNNKAMTVISNTCAWIRNQAIKGKIRDFGISFIYLPGFPPLWWTKCNCINTQCNQNDCLDHILDVNNWPKDFKKITKEFNGKISA